jgi:hypothetical protein
VSEVRAEPHAPGQGRRLWQRRAVPWLAGLAAPLVGTLTGAALVLTSTYQRTSLWVIWAPLAVVLTTAAGVVFTYGLRRWTDLKKLRPVRKRDVAWPVTGIAVVALVVTNSTAFLPGSEREQLRGGLLTSFVLLAALPAAGVMYGVSYTARSEPQSAPGDVLGLLVALRRLLRRLLAAVGSLVALSTLTTGAALALERSLPGSFSNRPPQYVLIFGGVGSLLVALVYVPAWSALQIRGLQLCDELFRIEHLEDPVAILSQAENRQKLAQILGADTSVWSDLQTGLAILAPLLASAAAAFLPH